MGTQLAPARRTDGRLPARQRHEAERIERLADERMSIAIMNAHGQVLLVAIVAVLVWIASS